MIRIFRHYVSSAHLCLFLVEWVVLVLGFYSGYLLSFHPKITLQLNSALLSSAMLLATLLSLSLSIVGLYRRMTVNKKALLHVRTLLGYFLGYLFMLGVQRLSPQNFIVPSISLYGLLIGYAGIWLTHSIFYRFGSLDYFKRRILVVGCRNLAAKLYSTNSNYLYSGIHVVGYAGTGKSSSPYKKHFDITQDGDITKACKTLRVKEIVIALDDKRNVLPIEELLDLRISGVSVVDLMTYYEREERLIFLNSTSPSWLLYSDGFNVSQFRSYVKRAFDIAVSIILLLASWWIMVLTALAIILESGWRNPILYRQVRIGLDGKPFELIKFRSMRVDAEMNGVQWASQNDDRATRVGRFIRKYRIDELPQLFLVFKGVMSFVGPRPERPEFVQEFVASMPYYKERHRVKPGITGWAQLCYPYGASPEDTRRKLEYDLYYIKNYSLFLDLSILLNTFEVIVFGDFAR